MLLMILGIIAFVACIAIFLYTHHLSIVHRCYPAHTNTSHTKPFPIDIIYTWVDGTDPHHQSIIKSYGETISYRRYANNNELYYSLQSIDKFAPWVRHIYIVTADYQTPDATRIPVNLTTKIKHIKHSEIIPKKYLPQFASQVIESFLYKIPDLSEQFIYFNDDMFLGNHVSPSDFFNDKGQPYMLHKKSLDYYSNSIKYLLKNTTRNSELRHSVHHFRSMFSLPKKFHYGFYKKPLHQCYPASKSLFETIWAEPKTKSFLERQAHDKFRSYNQLNIMYLMYLCGFQQQKAFLKYESSEIFKEMHTTRGLKRHTKRIFTKKPKLFCLNNELDTPNKTLESYFENQLHSYFE